MQLIDRVEDCNGCGACVVACKYRCVKMEKDGDGNSRPVVNENGCSKCNACMLFCPLYNPVELPVFEEFFDAPEGVDVRDRDMAPIYRAAMRGAREGKNIRNLWGLCARLRRSNPLTVIRYRLICCFSLFSVMMNREGQIRLAPCANFMNKW